MTKSRATKKGEEKKKMGRPTLFTERLVDALVALAGKGATDEELARVAGVGLSTFYAWKGRHPDFREALKNAKDMADDLVEASLYLRATGYSHKAIKFFCDKGRVITEEYEEHYPPDTTACIFWLKNRQPDRWREKQEVTHKVIEPFVITRRSGEQVLLGARPKEEDEDEAS